jgi:hypothetical protein
MFNTVNIWNPYSLANSIQKVTKLNSLDVAQQKVWLVVAADFCTLLKLDTSEECCKSAHLAEEENHGEILHEVLSFLQIC